MKIPKRIYTASTVLLLIGIIGVIFILRSSDDKPEKVSFGRSSTITKKSVEQNSTPVGKPLSKEQTAPVQSNVGAISPTPAENKDKVLARVNEYATSHGWSEAKVYAQTVCFDRDILAGPGYDDYDALFDSSKFVLLNDYFSGSMYFDGAGTCRLIHPPQT